MPSFDKCRVLPLETRIRLCVDELYESPERSLEEVTGAWGLTDPLTHPVLGSYTETEVAVAWAIRQAMDGAITENVCRGAIINSLLEFEEMLMDRNMFIRHPMFVH